MDPTLKSEILALRADVAQLRNEILALRSEEKWCDQHDSPLRCRPHIRLCRQLMAKGDPRARKDGRRWLVRKDAFAAPDATPVDLLEKHGLSG